MQLQTLDSNVDEAYFAHLWPLLARHSSTEVVIAADALPGVTVHDEKIMFHDELQRDLFRVLGEDDEGDPPVKTGDLNALLERYPARVRLRCTEDEIYYRLTGSRKRVSALTAALIVDSENHCYNFHLPSARCSFARERYLGPGTGASDGYHPEQCLPLYQGSRSARSVCKDSSVHARLVH